MLEVVLIAVSGALLSYMYAVSLEDGMIFEHLGAWLTDTKWWKKPLGGCIYCTTPYMTGLMALLFFFAHPVWMVVLTVTIAFFIIGLIDKHGML
jgi:hypothetical protein